MNGLAIDPWISALPKVELHVHVEGTLSPELRWKLARRNNVPLQYKTYEDLLDSYRITYNHRPELVPDGRPTFFQAYFGGCQVLLEEDDFYELGMELLARAKELNVRYLEPFFDLQAHTRRGVPVEKILNGFHRAQLEGVAQHSVHSNWILTIVRDDPVEDAVAVYEAARPWGRMPGGKGLFHSVGLASNEYDRPPMLFEQVFLWAKRDGLKVTGHCDVDQKDHHEHIHEMIFQVCGGKGADRIDHGLDVYSQPDLMEGLKARKIGLTLCPHAYNRRQATEVLFPKIRRVFDNGVKFCLNSDDPTYMHGVWIDGAMQKAYTYCNFTKKDMVALVRNGVEMSWAEDSIKESIIKELDEILV
ncbi:adenosine deaminase [Grosmannia clavigera kw1407]|uniref:Adenosine deaminase n=1 Tax=Grosmannia clavigera (strain kw1407 / UAMH 11150) TaxID=655863 RepID=F0XJR5_GROCL|nr:adenosine deaminase [Grosmannia clavigera kw1407]EFX02243.1 adenosine deaminase [Grosmannia clavigera kw1407]